MRRNQINGAFAAFMVIGGMAVVAGCGSGGNEQAPYAAAVAALERHGTAVRQAFTNDAPEKAHESLHELGNILDRFPTMVDGTDLSPADRETVKAASNELFDAYTELDMSMHGGDEVKYEDLEEMIDSNLAILKNKVEEAGHSGEHIVDPHEHDHAHGEEHVHDHDEEHAHDHEHDGHDHADEGAAEHEAEDHDHEEGHDHEEPHDHAESEADEEHVEGTAAEPQE